MGVAGAIEGRPTLTRRGWVVTFQPMLDALAAHIAAQLEYDAAGHLAPARRSA